MYSTNSKEMYFIDTEKMENEAIETGDKKRGTILIVEDNQEIPVEYYEAYILTDIQNYYVEKFH